MDAPVFPEEFVNNHCPKVLEARHWRKHYDSKDLDEDDDRAHAQCEFRKAGLGMECVSCHKFLTRPFTVHEVDRKFLPMIEEFYAQSDRYEKQEADIEAAKRKMMLDVGAGI